LAARYIGNIVFTPSNFKVVARILITGASGFIGGHLVELAAQRGMEVVAAVRKGSDTSRLQIAGVTVQHFDLGDPQKLPVQLQQAGRFDYIVHNAGVTKALKRETYFAVNQGVTINFVSALQATNLQPSQFVFVSSLAALGEATEGAERVYGTQQPKPLTAYGASKLAAEQWLEQNAPDFPWVIARPTAVYGPVDRDVFQFIAMVHKGLEVTAGSLDQKLSFIYGPDAAAAILDLATTPTAKHQKYILSDGHDYTARDLGDAVRAACNRKRTLKLQLPIAVLKPVAALVGQIGQWRGQPTALNLEKVAELAAKNWLCDSKNLFSDTRFKPQHNLASGMKAAVDWYKNAGWL
jgi:nucleoside-diphosphate-sugar epimerase